MVREDRTILEVIMYGNSLLHSLRRVADIYAVILLLACCTWTAEGDSMMKNVYVTADNRTSEPPTSAVPEKPVISNVSSDQVLSIYSNHDKVHLICEATGENITGGYWEKVHGGSLSPNHNNSKRSHSHDSKAMTLKLTIIRAHPIHSGRYRCVVYGQLGVTKSRKVNVIIKIAPPEIIQQPNNKSMVALSDGKLTCKARGYRVQYEWKRHNNNSIIGRQSNLTISRATPLDEDQYYCVAITEGGYAFSNNVTLTVDDYINLVIQPSHHIVTKGNSITINVIARGPGEKKFSYHWKRTDNASLPSTASGENTSNLTIASVMLSDGGAYYCAVMNQWGNIVKSDTVTIIILSVTVEPEKQTKATGQTIELTCIVNGTSSASLMYQWIISRLYLKPVVVNSSNVLTIPNASVSNSGVYYCVVFISGHNNTGVQSNSATVSILPLPVITTYPNSNGSITVGEGRIITLRCEATGSGTLNYQWRRVSRSLPSNVRMSNGGHVLTILNVTVGDSGQYYCNIDNGGDSVSSMKVQVIVKRKPTIISVPRSQTLNITNGREKVVLMCKVNGDNTTVAYWERLNGPLPKETNYTFDAKEAVITIKAHPHNSGDFRCIAQSQWGETHSRIVLVSIVAAPPVFIHQPNDKVVKALENVTLISKAEGFHVRYEWRYYNGSGNYSVISYNSTLTLDRVVPSNTGHYCCVAKTKGGKDHQVFSYNVTLTVNDSFTVTQDQEYIVTINNSVALTVVAKGPGSEQFKYQWEKVDSNSLPSTASGQDTPNLTIIAVTMFDGGSYRCNVTNQWETTVMSNVGLMQVLSVELHPLNNSVSVLGSSVNYTCKSTIASSGIQWVHNGTVLKNETSEFLNITNVQWNETGMYYCVTTTKNVSVESDRGYLIMSESAQPNTDENNILEIVLISIGVGVLILIVCCCCFGCIYYRCPRRKLSLHVSEVSITETITMPTATTAIVEATTTTSSAAAGTTTPTTIGVTTKNSEVTATTIAKAKASSSSSSSSSLSSITIAETTAKMARAVSLPRKQFKRESATEIQVSIDGTSSIVDIVKKLNPELRRLVDIKELLPYLIKYRFLTTDEREHLELKSLTNVEKVQYLLSKLDSKGVTGQENFVKALYELSKEEGNTGHCEIIRLFKNEGISIN